ncbi:MAG TPA: hypothetical protein VKV79_02505 [Terriglobia bacterium]|nr:hypothetical protein [Terriglobia bacterium]
MNKLQQTLLSIKLEASAERLTSLAGLLVVEELGRAKGLSRRGRNRSRHLLTACVLTPHCWATTWLEKPSPQLSTMRDRKAKRCAVFGRLAHCANFSRSWFVKTSGFLGSCTHSESISGRSD